MTVDEAAPSKAMFWTGWVISGLVGTFLLFGAFTALTGAPMAKEGVSKFSFVPEFLFWMGVTELLCAVTYLIPATATIGAILMTAYLGGAVATHARIGDPAWVGPVVFGVLVWVGLLMRRPGLRRSMLGW